MKRISAKTGKVEGTRVTYNKDGRRFEILCDTHAVAHMKQQGHIPPLDDILSGEHVIYRSRGLKNGNRATKAELEAAFGTSDPTGCLTAILQNKFPALSSDGLYKQSGEDHSKESGSRKADDLPEQALDPSGPSGLPLYLRRGLSEDVIRAACLAWTGPNRDVAWDFNRSMRPLVVDWLTFAMEASCQSQAVEVMALRVLAHSHGLSHHEDSASRRAEHQSIIAPLRKKASALAATEEAELVQYAKSHQLHEQLHQMGPSCFAEGFSAAVVTQQPHLAFMDPDLYPLIDHLAAREGFLFTEYFHWCAMAIIAEFLHPFFKTACESLATQQGAVYQKMDPKLTWELLGSDYDHNYHEVDILNSFWDWQRELPDDDGYKSDEEPDEAKMESWRAYHPKKPPLVTGAHVVDALRGSMVSLTVEEQMSVLGELQRGLLGNMIGVRSSFQEEPYTSKGFPPCVSANIVFEPGMTFSSVVDSPEFTQAVATLKESPHPDDDDEDYDMAAAVLRALLPRIGTRKVSMVAEVRLLLDFYAQKNAERPSLWSVVSDAKDLRNLSRTCQVRLSKLVSNGLCAGPRVDGICKEAVWLPTQVLSLSTQMGANCMQLVCRNLSGDTLCAFNLDDVAAKTWADVEPLLLHLVLPKRDTILKFVLPSGRQISRCDESKGMGELLAL